MVPWPESLPAKMCWNCRVMGGPVILDLLLKRDPTIPGLRIARPGEFSQRAFLNDKRDLAQAEGHCRS